PMASVGDVGDGGRVVRDRRQYLAKEMEGRGQASHEVNRGINNRRCFLGKDWFRFDRNAARGTRVVIPERLEVVRFHPGNKLNMIKYKRYASRME
ncbi:hypothetical protein, partial [Parabacteroides distasonis]|uniref:hypothetical protein n=2 Tax=Tannerellaceae TaxID=2005525 RepID=UPI00325BBBB8